MEAARFYVPFLLLPSVPVGYALGGGWSFLTLPVLLLVLLGLDGLLGEERATPRGARGPVPYRLLPWLYIPLQLATIAWGAWIAGTGRATPLEFAGLTLSVGTLAGTFGLLAAHEMIHSTRRAERALGLAMLAGVGYMHFRIAHVYGHHRRAATPEDPATARLGEGAYRFLVRSVLGQIAEAWALETARLRRQRRHRFGRANRMLHYLGIGVALYAALAIILGWPAVAFFAGQSLVAIALLELFNYIAHYGLRRREVAPGALERLGPQHSWNSPRRGNNWSLLNMGRHSDHHRAPARPYQRLEPLPGVPELPAGYAGTILIALIPPLWRRLMNPRVRAWTAGAADPPPAPGRGR